MPTHHVWQASLYAGSIRTCVHVARARPVWPLATGAAAKATSDLKFVPCRAGWSRGKSHGGAAALDGVLREPPLVLGPAITSRSRT